MLHTPAQYSPRQMLESGHRAEAEGKFELAGQLYWHVSETYPHSAEGAEAYASLARIGYAPQQSQAQPQQGAPARGPHGPYVGTPYAMPAAGGKVEPRAPAARPRKLPIARQLYGMGRGLASTLAGVGWLLLLVGLIAPGAYALGLLPSFGLPVFVALALGLAVVGLLAVLAGQIAHALFDQANAMRELVSIERAKWSADNT